MPAGVTVAEHGGESAALLSLLEGVEDAVLVDACVSGAAPGTVRRFDVSAAPLPEARFSLSTHGLGLAEAMELARALGQLPPRCIVYAIEGRTFELGAPLSPEVAAAVGAASDRIAAEIAG
jgi:hydrogenase maturation protease